MALLARFLPVTDERLAAALASGLDALIALQQPDGSFPLQKWSSRMAPQACHALFGTACVLLAAGRLLPAASADRAVAYVRRQRGNNGFWNFDPAEGIPDDSDDTACALAVLARHGALERDPALEIALLRGFWRSDGGPFATWRCDEQPWTLRDRDDAVVNCNVALALQELGAKLSDDEENAIRARIRLDSDGSRYYCSPATILYAAARVGMQSAVPVQACAKPRDGLISIAQWITAHDGQRHSELLKQLLGAQGRDGSWPREPWFQAVGASKPRWGSPAVSTALCVQAIATVLRVPVPSSVGA